MNLPSEKVIGIDFDNTLVTYGRLFDHLARERGWIKGPALIGKTAVRNAVRRLPDGENRWQELQALAYGPLIHQAEPSPGVVAFLKRCRLEGATVHVISHKTRFAAKDRDGCHLHEAALGWLERNLLFEPSSRVLTRKNVHFLPTRSEKVRRIGMLGCHYFIDDLEETFLEPGFPAQVVQILYSVQPGSCPGPKVMTAGSFQDVETIIFG